MQIILTQIKVIIMTMRLEERIYTVKYAN